jgi:hypothetical protein
LILGFCFDFFVNILFFLILPLNQLMLFFPLIVFGPYFFTLLFFGGGFYQIQLFLISSPDIEMLIFLLFYFDFKFASPSFSFGFLF